MYLEELKELAIPAGLQTRSEADRSLSLLRGARYTDTLTSPTKLDPIVNALTNPALDTLILEGKVTLGLIKPRVFEGKGLPSNDDQAAQVIMNEIERVCFQLPWRLTKDEIELFYAPLIEKYSERPQAYTVYGTKVWESISNHATSGPITVMLISGDNAIEWWRNKMGSTQPSVASPDSIRGRYGIQTMLPNNLVHGSDKMEEVQRELTVIRDSIRKVQSLL